MSLDIIGIRNVGDFYSQHYLDTLLAGDLQSRLDAWNKTESEGGAKSPPKRLSSLSGTYFKAVARATGEADILLRLEAAQGFHADLLDALGYIRSPAAIVLDDGTCIPSLVEILENGRPYLWAIEAPFPENPDDADPLGEIPLTDQLPPEWAEVKLASLPWKDLLDGPIFRTERAPRWILFLAGGDLFLIDRNKWSQGKYLRFELGVLMGRRDQKAMRVVAGLLHHDVLVPGDGGQSLLDKIDEQSHKHAFAVSTDLKYGAQQAIEILANEAIYYKRTTSKEKVFGDPLLAKDLARECIVYLYRLLFLFYVEARGQELGVVPMGMDSYRLGYSLETLRDLELVPLTSLRAREGFFIDDSLRKLFHLVQRGYGLGQQSMEALGDGAAEGFRLPGLRSALFDESRTPFMRGVKLRNEALQKVLQLLSLSKEGGKERGRISYAQLGINQLGAVYEGLLSYSGFFAQEDLFEVQSAGSTQKSDSQSWFVPSSKIAEYTEKEIVTDPRGGRVVYKKGTFLFRLAGRDREKSASYYTPVELTECLTKYTLKERLKGLKADEIPRLTVCEPAMGSGAFMNEAINQLAHAYLERKQAETGITLPADQYQAEWQKVKYHIGVNNSYGVDLNPLATELGKVSVWLNVLQPDVNAPYLDLRLRVGNSLIGARRELFDGQDLIFKGTKAKENWLSKVPEKLSIGKPRKPGMIYHFLVPDGGMAPFDGDKVVAELEPANVRLIKAWRKSLATPFTQTELRRLEKICDRIDALWEGHWKQRVQVLEAVRQPVSLWGQPVVDRTSFGPRDAETCEEASQVLREAGSPGQVIKTVLDYWCALYFWPVREASSLPSREEWIGDVERLLETGGKLAGEGEKRVGIVRALAEDKHFFHWELEFPEVFANDGGMDVILGNPPWRKLEWEESGVLSDLEPLVAVRSLSAKQASDTRAQVLSSAENRDLYCHEYEDSTGAQSFFASSVNYPTTRGVQCNLYKTFLVMALLIGRNTGAVGLLHQPGIFEDPNGGRLRSHLAKHLRFVAFFRNELKLFNDIGNVRPFVFSVCGAAPTGSVHFDVISNLLHPKTLDASMRSDGAGDVPSIKTADGEWELRGHKSRLVHVNEATLALFAKLYDSPGTPALEAKLPIIHSQEILAALRRFADAPSKLGDLSEQYFCTEHFHETSQQKDGTIRRETRFPQIVTEWIISGPHFHVATPFSKTPNSGCSSHRDYASLDQTVIPNDYLPRTNYVPACSATEYRKRTPHWKGRPVTEFARIIFRNMLAPTGERTLIGALLPKGPGHINGGFSVAFENSAELLALSAAAFSIVADFFVKTTGKMNLHELATQIFLVEKKYLPWSGCRTLRLSCLTNHYAPLWEELYLPDFRKDSSANPDPRAGSYAELTPTWNRDIAFRTPYARRQALVELDALAALSLGMTLEELLLIYRVQFPVLQEYERDTWYDQRGKIIFTVHRGLADVGLKRPQWAEIRDAKAGDKLPDWARDQQGKFIPPFDRCDRETDMSQAYRHFEGLLGSSHPKAREPG